MHTLAVGTLQNLSYLYDSTGNITTITDSINSLTQSFGYDALDRLTSASASGTPAQGAYSETYEYDPLTGNLNNKGGTTLDYLDSSHVHAVTNANSNAYAYDPNGNQITRNIGSDTFNLYYDAENRLVEVKKNNVTIAQFTFDGDGKRVKSVMDGETILFVGSHFEQKGSQATKYYFAGASRIAIRKYTVPQSMTVEYMLGDHLGSTSITIDNLGTKISEMRYKAWGETRYTWTNAPVTTPTYELTKYQYTGQYSYDAEFGLKFYNARWYDSGVGRFVSADSIIPPGPQGYDRYAYTNNNPIIYTDPNGPCPTWGVMAFGGTFCGTMSDYLGVTRAILWTRDSRIAAALAVQGQWLGPWDNHMYSSLVERFSPSSGYGSGQITDDEMIKFGLKVGSQNSPWGSAKAMEMRIDTVLSACDKFTCSATDKLIATALAQNGGFTNREFKDLLNAAGDNGIDWSSYFDQREATGGDGGLQGFRAVGFGEGRGGFDTRFQLQLYINDLLLLARLGWEMPYGLTEDDLIEIQDEYTDEE